MDIEDRIRGIEKRLKIIEGRHNDRVDAMHDADEAMEEASEIYRRNEIRDKDIRGGTKKMTPEEKIAALVEHIKKGFPNVRVELPGGCKGVDCEDCPLDDFIGGTKERELCRSLIRLI